MSGDLPIEGYASVFWARDLAGDVTAKGAFAESLARLPAAGVAMLHGHDARTPVGVWDELAEDARGLFARGRISGETAAGRLCAALARRGRLDGLSIGFRTRRARRGDFGRLRVLAEVDLLEVSLTPRPLLPQARFALAADPSSPLKDLSNDRDQGGRPGEPGRRDAPVRGLQVGQ